MNVETRALEGDDAALVVCPRGDLNAGTLDAFEATLVDLEKAGRKRVVLDLSDTTFLSSAAWALLIQLAQRLRRNGGGLALCAMAANVHEVHEVLDLGRVLPAYADVAAAAAQLSTPR